jgi:hypothetical protein
VEETRVPPRVWKTLRPDVFLGFSSGLHRYKPGCQTDYGEYFCVTGWAGKLHVFTLIYRAAKRGLKNAQFGPAIG